MKFLYITSQFVIDNELSHTILLQLDNKDIFRYTEYVYIK